ncbi:MAG: cohesin domain-containing protein [Saprospiraceae bacterium]
MKPAVTYREFRRLSYALTLVFCIFSTHIFSQPTPEINGETTPCKGEVYLYSTPFNGNSWLWSVSSGGTIISPVTDNSVYVQWDGPTNSSQWILVQEDDGMNPPVTVQQTINIASNVLSCENTVHVSLDQTGVGTVTPQMLLDGNYLSYGNFQVTLSLANGVSLGDVVTCGNIGQTVIGRVTDGCTGNSCWSNIKVEDKKAPVWQCPTSPVDIACDTDIDNYPHPTVEDNCDNDPLISLTGIQIDNSDICQGVTIIRNWIASDDHDNESYCTQVLQISPDQEVMFPDDKIWQCNQYAVYPNITDPTAYDSTSFATTGSGVPLGATGPYCPYSFSNHDDTLFTCGNAFKIIRTWTVLNWCTQQIVTTDMAGNDNEQVIKILDLTKPLISVPPITLRITEPGPSAIACRSLDFMPAPVVSDDCGGVTVKIYTEVGEAVYANGVDGKEGGYVPSPGLGLGPHTITYVAIDDCGNERELLITANVIDDEAPIAICDEITSASLDQFGNTLIFAETFNDGSYDNCCIGDMLVKKMGQPDSYFAPALPLDCSEEIVNVVFRVFDCFDNHADCMVIVEVEDKLPPVCVPPAQKDISCTDLAPDITDTYVQSFGQTLTYDNCNSEIVELPYTVDINACGEGQIIRHFNAVDDSGNQSLGACEQHIYVHAVSDWLINFPPNWTGECGDSITAIDLVFGEFGCEQLAYTYSDQYFAISNDSACFKIVRTWEVINWCTYDNDLDPIIVPTEEFGVLVNEDTYNNFGHYVYQQIIKIHDTRPPVLSTPFTYNFCTTDADCVNGNAFLPIQIDGECSTDMDIIHLIDLNKNGFYEINGTGFFDGQLPIGVHNIRYIVEDGCGNESQIDFDFEIRDCKPPSPVCTNGLIVEIMQTGMIEVCAESLLEYAIDNCPGTMKVSFSPNVMEACDTFFCDDIGQIPVEIWVTDAAGNQDYCENYIVLQDNMDVCGGGQPLVGFINTFNNDEPVEGVAVYLSNTSMNEMYMTPGTGMFEFMDLPIGQDYSITPEKDDDFLNGVTTYDLVLISRHILAIEPLDSPYKMIAADINNSQSITTFDLVSLRKVILYINDVFPNNSSWRFVDKNYTFPVPNNPWAEVFPEVININNMLTSVNDADFKAIKIGDINGSATPNNNFGNGSTDDRDGETLMFSTDKRLVEAGENIEVIFSAKDFVDVYGFQFTIDYDVNKLSFQHINNTELMHDENYGLALLNDGAITALWYETSMFTLTDGTPIISLQFEVKKSCQLSEVINISSRYTMAAAYVGEEMNEWEIGLEFDESLTAVYGQQVEGFNLYQNVPNPFSDKTTIGFDLPIAGQAKLTILDSSGRILREIEGNYPNGYSSVLIDSKGLPNTGILFYKIESAGLTAVRQMTLAK